ncbi:MAG: nucleotide pyrophosphohydrolase [Thermoplasmatota archaeon]
MHPFDAVHANLRDFVSERDWDPFHTPKDLAVGLAVEAGELLENFQWVSPSPAQLEQDVRRRERIQAETADVFLYSLLLADKLGFDIIAACEAKLAANRAKYPVEKAKGRATKYTEL